MENTKRKKMEFLSTILPIKRTFKSEVCFTKKELYFTLCKFIFVFAIFFTVNSCNSDEFNTTKDGIKYKYTVKNEDGKKAQVSDIVQINLKYYNQKDSLIFNSLDISTNFRIKIKKNKKSLFDRALLQLFTGEKAIFWINAENFYIETQKKQVPDFIKKDEDLKFEIALNEIISPEIIEKEKAEKSEKLKQEEQTKLEEYISINEIEEKPTKTGLFIIKNKQGTGKKTQIGDTAVVHYNAFFITGEIFDSSIERDEPFIFVIGKNEVIPAWEEAILTMKVGDKITLISPSSQAYGEQGYGKTIPPFSTLVFEIKLLKLR